MHQYPRYLVRRTVETNRYVFVLDSSDVRAHYGCPSVQTEAVDDRAIHYSIQCNDNSANRIRHYCVACNLRFRSSAIDITYWLSRSCCHCIDVCYSLRCYTQIPLSSASFPSNLLHSSHSHPSATSLSFIFPPSFSARLRLLLIYKNKCIDRQCVADSGGARPGPAGARAPAKKGCAPAVEVGQN